MIVLFLKFLVVKKKSLSHNSIVLLNYKSDEICSITGEECPLYYIGNHQKDGFVMLATTFSGGIQEKQFVFFIKNETLSYEECVNGKPVPEPESGPIPALNHHNHKRNNRQRKKEDQTLTGANHNLATSAVNTTHPKTDHLVK